MSENGSRLFFEGTMAGDCWHKANAKSSARVFIRSLAPWLNRPVCDICVLEFSEDVHAERELISVVAFHS